MAPCAASRGIRRAAPDLPAKPIVEVHDALGLLHYSRAVTVVMKLSAIVPAAAFPPCVECPFNVTHIRMGAMTTCTL